MNAGRELDALVAEKVMQWHPVTCGQVVEGLPVYCSREHQERPVASCHTVLTAYSVPAYSTDIAAAWEVVERLRASGMPVIIHAWHHGPWCKVTVYEPLHEYEATGESVPECICLAALKAVGVEVDESA